MMQNISELTSLITNIGFPIVCVIMLWKYVSTQTADLTKSLNDITITLNKICDRLDDFERRIDNDNMG